MIVSIFLTVLLPDLVILRNMELWPVVGIILLRLVVPLFIVRFPLAAGLLCIVLDYFDFHFLGGLSGYQQLDKILDVYYLSFEALVVFFWQNRTIRSVTLGLFFYRMIGVLAFEIIGARFLLVLFPNLFEIIFILYLLYQKITARLSTGTLFKVAFQGLLILGFVYKMYQELSLHLIQRSPWIGSELIGLH